MHKFIATFKTYLGLIGVVLIISSCTNKQNIESLIIKNGVPYTTNSEDPYSGQIFKLFSNGKVAYEGSYKNGIKSGQWLYYNLESKIIKEENYNNGIKDGTWKVYDDSGSGIINEQNFKNGILDGPFSEETNSLGGAYNFSLKSNYKNGKLNGTYLLRVLDHKSHASQHEDMQWNTTGEFEDGQKTGLWNEADYKLGITSSGTYTKGKPTGIWEFTNSLGQSYSINYTADELLGNECFTLDLLKYQAIISFSKISDKSIKGTLIVNDYTSPVGAPTEFNGNILGNTINVDFKNQPPDISSDGKWTNKNWTVKKQNNKYYLIIPFATIGSIKPDTSKYEFRSAIDN